jgi:uncharacterized protein YeaO (DUF488 family)
MTERKTGKIYTSCFLSFGKIHPKLPDADWIAVTRTNGFMRGSGESAELRRKHIRWLRLLSPSRKLHLSYMKSDKGDAWTEFIEQFEHELLGKRQKELLMELAESVAAGRTIVLMCYEKAGEKCHRRYLCKVLARLVKDIIGEESDSVPFNGIAGGELCPSPVSKKVAK